MGAHGTFSASAIKLRKCSSSVNLSSRVSFAPLRLVSTNSSAARLSNHRGLVRASAEVWVYVDLVYSLFLLHFLCSKKWRTKIMFRFISLFGIN